MPHSICIDSIATPPTTSLTEDTPLTPSSIYDSPSSPSSEDSLDDDEDNNCRIYPNWCEFREILACHGFFLDTVADAKMFYGRGNESVLHEFMARYHHVEVGITGRDDNALSPDPGLCENLFRGTRASDGRRVMVKAVHVRSREWEIIRHLSASSLRNEPFNHCIPVIDLIDIPNSPFGFIVMEEWSSQIIDDQWPCCMTLFMSAIRQLLEHGVLMHSHDIVHLDISLRNILTDLRGHYAYIDFELSRFMNGSPDVLVSEFRCTEVPPECQPQIDCTSPNMHDNLTVSECIDSSNDTSVTESSGDLTKIDVWALGVTILRACKISGFFAPQLMDILKPMLDENPAERPPLSDVLIAFNKLVESLNLPECLYVSHKHRIT